MLIDFIAGTSSGAVRDQIAPFTQELQQPGNIRTVQVQHQTQTFIRNLSFGTTGSQCQQFIVIQSVQRLPE